MPPKSRGIDSGPLTAMKIIKSDFESILARYPGSILSPNLIELDPIRYETIPKLLAERKKNGNPFLDKKEVEQLVDWKLRHGKYRPKLASLVASNDAALIHDTTHSVFTTHRSHDGSGGSATPRDGVNQLKELRGIGPATASLLLSVYDPAGVPFFSDELFRYLFWAAGPTNGWNRKIGYTLKEYGQLVEEINPLMERLGVGAVEVEKVAYVLGKEEVDLFSSGVEEDEHGKEKETNLSDNESNTKTDKVEKAPAADSSNSREDTQNYIAPRRSKRKITTASTSSTPGSSSTQPLQGGQLKRQK